MSADIDARNEIKEEFVNADDNLSTQQYNNNNQNNNNDNMQDNKDFFHNDNLSEQNNSGQDSPKFIRLRGLPWSATHQEILDFLKNVNVVNGSKGIHLVTSRWDGKNTGEAYVEVESQQDVDEARKLNKALMEHRYIEVFTASPKEAKEAMRKTGSHGGSYVVKLRGLPYAVTEQQIEEFFSGLEIKLDREGILFVMDRRGRATGEAFVQFESQDDTEQALGRNREKIGHRYIEIFRSSLAELKRASTGNGRPVPYDIKERGGNRGNFNDFNNGGRSNSRDGWSNGNFNVGASNTLGFNNLPHFTNSGNFGNGFGQKNSSVPNSGGIFGNNNNNNIPPVGGSSNSGNFGNFPNFANSGNFGHGGMNNGGGNNNSSNNNNTHNGGNNPNSFGNFNNNNNNSRALVGGGVGMIANASGFPGNNRFNNGNGNFGNDFGDFNNFGNQRNFNGNNFGTNGGGGGNMNDFGLNRNNSMNSNSSMGNNGNFGNFGNDNMPSNNGNFNNGGSNVCNFGPVGGGRGDFFTIHMRGLPYSCFENDVFKFFDPIRPVNVRINFNKKGLHSGTADVFFEVYEDAQLAMKRHREQMGSRYIELFFDGKTKGPANNNNNHNNNNYNNTVPGNKNMLHGNNAGNNFSRRI